MWSTNPSYDEYVDRDYYDSEMALVTLIPDTFTLVYFLCISCAEIH